PGRRLSARSGSGGGHAIVILLSVVRLRTVAALAARRPSCRDPQRQAGHGRQQGAFCPRRAPDASGLRRWRSGRTRERPAGQSGRECRKRPDRSSDRAAPGERRLAGYIRGDAQIEEAGRSALLSHLVWRGADGNLGLSMDALSWSGSRVRPHVRLRRTLFFGLTLLTAGCASALVLDVLQANSLSVVELLG